MPATHRAFCAFSTRPRRSAAAVLLAVLSAASTSRSALAQPEPHPRAAHAGTATPTSKAATPAGNPATASGATAGPTGELPNLPVAQKVDITDTREDPEQKYYFVGLRYRGTVIPQAFMNLFVEDGATIYSNSLGAELDIRQKGNSLIPWIQYTDYNTGDILFLQKGQPDWASNRSVVNSSLKALYLGLDEMWSAPLAPDHLDFEFGFGVGIGGLFGSLMNNWVYQTTPPANGKLGPNQYKSTNGNYYALCLSQTPGPYPLMGPDGAATNGCNPAFHTSSNPAKVGRFNEKNWFDGGPVPVIFPYISIPQIGLRYKPIKQFETRLDVGFGLTGLWFGLSVDYGLEKTAEQPKVGWQTRARDTL